MPLNKQAASLLSLVMDDMAHISASLGTEVKKLSGKTILITGANGFLPSYLADFFAYLNQHHLLNQATRILLLIRSDVEPGSRLAHLKDRSDIEFIVQDVCDPITIEAPVHFIVHAASPASPKWYRADPVGTVDTNSIALRQLLRLAKNHQTESFLYFSSSEVYGNPGPENIPTPESYLGTVEFTKGRACYAESKRFGETMCASHFEQYGIPVKVVRPFHIHGPGLRIDDGRIVAEMILQGLNDKPFELLSAGSATRTYGYVSDATVGFLKVLLSDCNGEAFNVGADSPETSILELATIISNIFGKTDPVKTNTTPDAKELKGAPNRACPDLSKIRRLLGYHPAVPLETGLERTVAWHQHLKDYKIR